MEKIDLNISGKEGNAYLLLALFKEAAALHGCSPEEIDQECISICASSDYDTLLNNLLSRINQID